MLTISKFELKGDAITGRVFATVVHKYVVILAN